MDVPTDPQGFSFHKELMKHDPNTSFVTTDYVLRLHSHFIKGSLSNLSRTSLLLMCIFCCVEKIQPTKTKGLQKKKLMSSPSYILRNPQL